MIFNHGFLLDHTMFGPQTAALSSKYRVVIWDDRGTGSSVASGPYTLWDSARDVIAILDDLAVERAVVCGMSQGGYIALRVALTAPERVLALVLMDTQAGVEDPEAIKDFDVMRDVWLAEGPSPVQEVVASIILGPGEWAEWFTKWAELDRDKFALSYRSLVEREDLNDRLKEISCPALIVHGTNDQAIPLARGREMRDGLAGPTTFVEVPTAPHAANLTHPEIVNAAVLEFLSEV